MDFVDNNLLAVAATQENLRRQNLVHASVLPGDVLESVEDRQYDLIITNPPFHAGQPVDYQMAEAFIDPELQPFSA